MSTKPVLSLAPIRGLTDAPFRNLLARHFTGFDFSIAPFINPMKDPGVKAFKDVFPENNTSFPIIPQVLNNDAEEFIKTAKILADLGYTEINWNLGCPAPMVAKKKRGSGMLPYPERIIEVLDEIMPKLPVKLSIKTRLGFHSTEETLGLLPQLDQYPLTEIIIHARLGKQLYRGTTDPDSFALCLERSTHKIAYNGDILTVDDYKVLSTRFPEVEHFMIGRGAITDLFLPSKIKGIDPGSQKEQLTKAIAFHSELMDCIGAQLSGDSHITGRLKMFWEYFGNGFPNQQKELKKIRKSRTMEQYREATQILFENYANELA